MNKTLEQLLKAYSQQLATLDISPKRAGKYTLAGSAALATMVAGPVELASQTVCGNLGAPTRTVGSCIGGTGNIGVFFNDNYCAKFDFDGDGVNELQVRYYNVSGVYPAAFFSIDPLTASNQLWSARIDAYFGDPFPVNAAVGYLTPNGYNISYSNKLFIVPLSTGSGFGFIAMDARAYTFGQGNHGGAHPVTGQPICCWGYGEVVLWGADTGITISDFTVTSGDMTDCSNLSAVLPVEFSRFTATAEEDRIQLEWTTSSETNNAGFEVERSADGGSRFQTLGFVNGAGDSRQEKTYSFFDETARPGQEYVYRVKQIDFDGSHAYSDLATAKLSSKGFRATLFPNPTSTNAVSLTLENALSDDINITVYNATGQLLHQNRREVAAGNSTISLTLEDLTAGVYFVKLEQAGVVTYERLIVE
ncbi:MAG: T9SS type A sorting domain-containing protein [Bacteroidota bacterium]